MAESAKARRERERAREEALEASRLALKLAARPPAWAGLLENQARMSGAAAGPAANAHELAVDVWGERACARRGAGLFALGYLWRRFGPSPDGYDPGKELATYYLATPDPEVGLWVSPRLSRLSGCVGYVLSDALNELVFAALVARRSRRKWTPPVPWREDPGPSGRVCRALAAAMTELRRPVYVRDSALTVLGPCRGRGHGPAGVTPAEPSGLAGLGVPLEPMRKLLEPEPRPRPSKRRKHHKGG